MWITNTREGDVLQCRLQHFWLESKPRYTAISYVWGDANDTVRLSLEGCDFYVTRNLHEALLQVRRWRNQPNLDYSAISRAQGPWLLWADAICIDQKNMAERLREISRMKDIFSSATTVLGWLGLPPLDIDELRVATVFGKAIEIVQKTTQDERLDLIMRPEHPVKNEVSVDFEGFTKAFFAIIALSWFSRVWIIQECAVAQYDPILALGRVFMPFDCLRSLYSLYAYRHEWLLHLDHRGFCIAPISEIRNWYHDPKLHHSILDSQVVPEDLDTSDSGCITNFARRLNIVLNEAAIAPFSSTVPHDMIYGVLSMASQGLRRLPKEIQPDYSQPFSDVCRSYARFIAEHTGDLSFLWRFRDGDNKSHFDRSQGGVPSWVPNFCGTAPLTGSKTPIRTKPLFSADGSIMYVEGIQVDTICSIVKPELRLAGHLNAANVLSRQARRIYELLEMAATIQNVPVNRILQDWLKSFERMVDRVYDQSESEVPAVSLVFMSWIQSNAEEGRDTNLVKDDSNYPSARVKSMIDVIKRQLVWSSFFLTRDGSIWASMFRNEAVQGSDIICILSGAPTPTILRPTGAQFKFLSVAKLYAGPGLEHIENASVWESSMIFPLV
jgi:hypothetical protein